MLIWAGAAGYSRQGFHLIELRQQSPLPGHLRPGKWDMPCYFRHPCLVSANLRSALCLASSHQKLYFGLLNPHLLLPLINKLFFIRKCHFLFYCFKISFPCNIVMHLSLWVGWGFLLIFYSVSWGSFSTHTSLPICLHYYSFRTSLDIYIGPLPPWKGQHFVLTEKDMYYGHGFAILMLVFL